MQIELTKEELTEMIEAAVERRVKSLVTNLSVQQLADRQVQLWVWDKLHEMDIEATAKENLSRDLLEEVQQRICQEIALAIADRFNVVTDDSDIWD